jgi:hypothetical protein
MMLLQLVMLLLLPLPSPLLITPPCRNFGSPPV